MALRSCCGIAPLLFRHKSSGFETMKSSDVSKNKNEVEDLKIDSSRGWAGSFILMMELRKKILIFRDIIDLPPCDGSASINELLLGTTRDLHKLFPEIIPSIRLSEMKGTSIEQALAYFCGALKSIADSWMTNHDCTTKSKCTAHGDMENSSLEQLVKVGLETLECLIKAATEKFDLMDEEDLKKEYCPHTDAFDRISGDLCSDKSSGCHSPVTPTSVLPEIPSKSTQFGEFANVAHTPSLLLPFRAQALGKLNPIDVKRLSFHMFPHVVAQDSRTMIQKNMTAEEPKPETEVKNHSEEMVTDIIEEAKNCKTTNETRMVQMSYLNEEKIGDAGNQVAALVQTPEIQAKEAAGDLLLPALALQMPPNAAPAPAQAPLPPPPPSLPKLSLNVVAPALAQAPLPPPSLPKLSINVVAPAMTPSPPKLQEIITSTITSPPAPPPPPPPSPKMSINATAPPLLPPPMMAIKGSVPSPPPPMPTTNGAGPPPPPPLGAARSLRPKKSTTKLKRSTHMGNLYRVLKGKVEGSCLTGKSTQGRKAQSGGSSGGSQGMADALAEMTKRSAYFQQIEEDVQKYPKTITELKAAITSFQTKDMSELLKFHKYVESQLERLTDESQVLARFEGFPTKKLEALRMVVALYLKLDTILTNLVNWKIVAPLNQLLDKVESYFNKIKGEVDALERIKDEEFKKFQTHNIHFDFHILVKIKESMVDVSSGCMELALKEGREAKATANEETMLKKGARAMGSAKMLWKAFQFAFRVYTFAGGQDDRADKLTRELAQEIETGQ